MSGGGYDTDLSGERRKLLFLFVVEPAALVKFASQALGCSGLVTDADVDQILRFVVDSIDLDQ